MRLRKFARCGAWREDRRLAQCSGMTAEHPPAAPSDDRPKDVRDEDRQHNQPDQRNHRGVILWVNYSTSALRGTEDDESHHAKSIARREEDDESPLMGCSRSRQQGVAADLGR